MTDATVTELASRQKEGKKTVMEKVRWMGQSLGIQLRTRRWVTWLLVGVFGLGVALTTHYMSRDTVAPKTLCECPLAKQSPSQGKKQTETKAKTKVEK